MDEGDISDISLHSVIQIHIFYLIKVWNLSFTRAFRPFVVAPSCDQAYPVWFNTLTGGHLWQTQLIGHSLEKGKWCIYKVSKFALHVITKHKPSHPVNSLQTSMRKLAINQDKCISWVLATFASLAKVSNQIGFWSHYYIQQAKSVPVWAALNQSGIFSRQARQTELSVQKSKPHVRWMSLTELLMDRQTARRRELRVQQNTVALGKPAPTGSSHSWRFYKVEN